MSETASSLTNAVLWKSGKFVAVAAAQGIIGWMATQTLMAISEPGAPRTVAVGFVWVAVIAAGAYVLAHWNGQQNEPPIVEVPAPKDMKPVKPAVSITYSDAIALPPNDFSWDLLERIHRLLTDEGLKGHFAKFSTTGFTAAASSLKQLSTDVRNRTIDLRYYTLDSEYVSKDVRLLVSIEYDVTQMASPIASMGIGGSDESRVVGIKVMLEKLVDSWTDERST